MKLTTKEINPKVTMSRMAVAKPEKKPISDETIGLRRIDYYRQLWDALYTFRREMERATRYKDGDQWFEKTTDRYGRTLTEEDHIALQGQIPIIQNIIKPTIRTLQGQFRSGATDSIVVSRTPEEGKESEMLSMTLQYNLDSVNDSKEVDSTTLEKVLTCGLGVQRMSYEYIPDLQRKDILLRDQNLYSMFFNGDIEDVRGYDIRVIGRLMDLTIDELIMYFGKTKQREEKLREIYSARTDQFWAVPEGLNPDDNYSKDFYLPIDISKCRVIEVWEKRIVPRMEVHDWADGSVTYTDWTKKDLEALNALRIQEYGMKGIPPEEVPPMEGEIENVQKWFYTYYSPWGHVLEEGESPFKHGSHPFVFFIHKISDGKIRGLAYDLIDTQRQYNRLHILNDRILASSVKNLLVVDKDSLDGQTREEIMDDMKEPGGVVVLDMKKGQGQVPIEIKGSIGNLGIPEMIQMYLRSLQDVSGVHPAMQGQVANSGTSGKLYQQQAQNSSMNSKDIMDAFASAQRRRDMKLLKTIQQYYDKPVMIAITGKGSSRTSERYDPSRLKDIDFDMVIGSSVDTPVYRSLWDDKLLEFVMSGLLDMEIALENSSAPGAAGLLESIRNRKKEAEQNPQAAIAGLAGDVQAAGLNPNQQVVDTVYEDLKTA